MFLYRSIAGIGTHHHLLNALKSTIEPNYFFIIYFYKVFYWCSPGGGGGKTFLKYFVCSIKCFKYQNIIFKYTTTFKYWTISRSYRSWPKFFLDESSQFYLLQTELPELILLKATITTVSFSSGSGTYKTFFFLFAD